MFENIDIRKGIKDISLYKRLAYESEGFSALTSFLKEEGLINDFYEEINFTNSLLKKYLTSNLTSNGKGKPISLYEFFTLPSFSFNFAKTRRGKDFWCSKIFENEKFRKIGNKVL